MISIWQSVQFGPICSFLSSCTWAIGAITYSKLSHSYSGPAVNFARAIVAFPLFCLSLYFLSGFDFAIFEKFLHLSGHNWFWFTASIIGSFVLGDTLFLLSTHTMGVAASLAIASTYPIWAALAGWIFLGSPFQPVMGLGVILVVSGTVVVILSGRHKSRKEHPAGSKYWIGVLLAIGTSFCWALNSFALSIASTGQSPVFANVIRALLSLILCPLLGFLLYRKKFHFIPFQKLKGSLWIILLEAYGGSLLFLYGINNSPLAIAAALSSLAPVVALGVSWGLKKEKLSPLTSAAVVAVVIGICFLVSG